MAAVDENFISRYPSNERPVFVRHVDDFWVAGNSQDECERHLSNLRLALHEFQLDINERKTKIISSKLVFADDWPFEFDRELTQSLQGRARHKNETLSILSKITDLATTSGDDGIVRHAIRLIDEERLWDEKWEILQHFLAQCAVQFPHSFDYVARVIAWRKRQRPATLDADLWKHVAISTIDHNAPLGRDSEVVWAMWLLKELNVPLPKKTTDLMLLASGPLPLALLIHMSVRKLTADRSLRGKLLQKVVGGTISGNFWPLTLEMHHLGKGDPAWLQEKIPAYLIKLHQMKASIIDWGAPPKVYGESADGPEDGPDEPSYAIEDYSADYGSDEVSDGARNPPAARDADDRIEDFFKDLLGPDPDAGPADEANDIPW
ncbi:hypothetical protein ACC689_09655 [Rhizobium ruizarguesonis]